MKWCLKGISESRTGFDRLYTGLGMHIRSVVRKQVYNAWIWVLCSPPLIRLLV